MLEKVYELLMSFVTLILGFFGIELGKKSVTFADEVESKGEETKKVESTPDSESSA
jgi:hypothetical protein